MHFHFLLRGTNKVSVENGGTEVVDVDANIILYIVFFELLPDSSTIGLFIILERLDELLVLLTAVFLNISYSYMLGIIYTSVYKMSECGKQLQNKAIYDGQIANSSVSRTDIAKSVRYIYRERTYSFRGNTVY
jgi:hypothetical protein